MEVFPPDHTQTRPSRTEGTHPSANFRVSGIGQITDHDTYWLLTYGDCNHSQAFARVGLDDYRAAAVYVRRHYARCLTCALATRPVPVQMNNVATELVLSPGELTTIVTALRAFGQSDLAGRLDAILRRSTPTPQPPVLP